jgi:hypothetical protein
VIGPSQRPTPDDTRHIHKRQASNTSAGFEPVILVNERPQTYASEYSETVPAENVCINGSHMKSLFSSLK